MNLKSALVGAIVALALVAAIGGAYALGKGGSSTPAGPSAQVVPVTAVPPTATPLPPPVPPPAAAAPPSQPPPPSAANRQNCALIRGTDYLSETERLWFLDNCKAPQSNSVANVASGRIPCGSVQVVGQPRFTPAVRAYEVTMTLRAVAATPSIASQSVSGPAPACNSWPDRVSVYAVAHVAQPVTPTSGPALPLFDLYDCLFDALTPPSQSFGPLLLDVHCRVENNIGAEFELSVKALALAEGGDLSSARNILSAWAAISVDTYIGTQKVGSFYMQYPTPGPVGQ
jgi:hypothetical protein